MIPLDKLAQIQQRFQFLEAKMNDGISGEEIAQLAKEYAEIKPVISQIEQYQALLKQIEDANEMIDDPDMKALAEEE